MRLINLFGRESSPIAKGFRVWYRREGSRQGTVDSGRRLGYFTSECIQA